MLNIRPAQPSDYPLVVQLIAQHEPETQATPQSMQQADQNTKPPHHRVRLVAELNGQVLGYATAVHMLELYHPQKFWMMVYVHLAHLRQGIGSALYKALLQALTPFKPNAFYSDTSEDWPHGLAFFAKHGFAETSRTWESWVNPQEFDPTPYQGVLAQVRQQGFVLRTWDELAFDAQRDHKYWQLEMALASDMPMPSSAKFTPYSFEEFQARFLQNTNWLPAGNLIAVAPDGAYVGLNAFWQNENNLRWLGNGTTGVLPAFKRRGIALALKVQNLMWAKAQGYERIKTFNRSDNLPMWNLNQRLGFVRTPAWVNFEKHWENP